MKRLIYTICLLVACLSTAGAKVLTEHKTRLTDNWLYLRGDIGNIWEAVRPASPGTSESVPLWTPVTLPHCFNATDDEFYLILKVRGKRRKYIFTPLSLPHIQVATMNGQQI